MNYRLMQYRCVVCGCVLTLAAPQGTLVPVCHLGGRIEEAPPVLTAEALG